MFSFKTRSYLEGIRNAFLGVDFKPRKWDTFNADETIITIVLASVPEVLAGASGDLNANPWYEEIEELGQLAQRLTFFHYGYEFWKEEQNDRARFGELLGRNLFHLWN